MDFGAVVMVPDDAPAEVSYARQVRMVAELYESLLRNLPGVDHDYAIACARNLASGWGYFGAVQR